MFRSYIVIHIIDITAERTHDIGTHIKKYHYIKGIIAGMKCFKVNTRDMCLYI